MTVSQPEAPRLTYQISGDGPPVLLLHGLLTDGSLWAPVVHSLSRRFRAVCCTIRRRMPDGRVATRATQDHVTDLLGLLDNLELPAAHLVSHGAGWAMAAGMAVRSPERVRSLTLVDPVMPRVEQSPAIQEAWHLETLLQWLSVAHGNVVRRPEHVAALQAIIAQQTHVHMDAPGTSAAWDETYTLLGCTPPPLSAVRCPLLALVGQEASAESKSVVASVFGEVHQGRILPVPGANRHSPLEAPDTVARLIGDFLA